ncbi:hypothetical protein FS594_15785 [Rahnella aquatilis]|nr:hypothetical protein FS594_15785 [Rahnella aquatilis]
MKERPVLFNAEMVKAILSGRKTQTRRVIKFPLRDVNMGCELAGNELAGEVAAGDYRNCPLGQPGDQLWVREAIFPAPLELQSIPPRETLWNIAYRDGKQLEKLAPAAYNPTIYNYERWTPSIHMPRWASRIQLEITKVGVQRLQEISSGDAVREGICQLPASGRYCINPGDQYFGGASHSAKEVYSWLWESIYGEGSWQANPWVWVIEFERVAPAGERS